MPETDLLPLEIYRPFLGAFVFIIGAVVGSFLNVVIWRLPQMMEREWRNSCAELLNTEQNNEPPEKFNLAFPSSHCPHCKHEIHWWENIPVISYLWLKGACSNCATKISIRYPLVEASTGLLSICVFIHFGLNPELLFGLAFTWILITLTLIDYDTQLLPDDLTLPLLWLGLLMNCFYPVIPLQDAVIGAAIGYGSLWSIYWAFKLLTGKEGMGYGDFKLLAALGAWMGWQALPSIILLSSITGAVIGISQMIIFKTNRDTPIPFGPFLAIAGWMTFLWQEQIAKLYLIF